MSWTTDNLMTFLQKILSPNQLYRTEEQWFCSRNLGRFEFSMSIYKIYQFSELCNNSPWFPKKDD